MKYYTGIGSRKTPQPILDMFERVIALDPVMQMVLIQPLNVAVIN